MREILFRGRLTDKSRWVYGCLLNNIYGAVPVIMTHQSVDDAFNLEFEYEHVEEKTVSQFTGLTDKNGTKIFEGDIVHVLGNQQVEDWKNVNYIGSVAFLDAGFCVIDGTIEDHALRRYQLPRLDFDLEVIGNIYDNTELLEEGDS